MSFCSRASRLSQWLTADGNHDSKLQSVRGDNREFVRHLLQADVVVNDGVPRKLQLESFAANRLGIRTAKEKAEVNAGMTRRDVNENSRPQGDDHKDQHEDGNDDVDVISFPPASWTSAWRRGLVPGGPVAPPLPEGWVKATILLFVIRMTYAVLSGSHQQE